MITTCTDEGGFGQHWTQRETEPLHKLYDQKTKDSKRPDWKAIIKHLPGRTAPACQARLKERPGREGQ